MLFLNEKYGVLSCLKIILGFTLTARKGWRKMVKSYHPMHVSISHKHVTYAGL